MKKAGFFCAVLLLACHVCGDVFKDGDRVCFFGDSITHGGRFHSYVYEYYLTRFPDATIHFFNAGVAGDSAGGAQGRLIEDVASKKPTAVAFMFGMNDVGRGNYVAEPSAEQRDRQKKAIDYYATAMERLVARVRAEAGDPRLIFLTPSPFDQTCVNDRNNNQPGCNDGLALCTKIVCEQATTNQGLLVDFHTPMTAFNLEQQKQNPAYTIIGPDRVHPSEPGHLMMAWLFLKAQGAPSLVSRVVIDVATAKVESSENATVTDLKQQDHAWHFSVLEKALPFPIAPRARALLEKLPIEKDLNQEILAVRGLVSGRYDLKIDDVSIGQYTAEALVNGVNLALNEATPQVKQAQAVARLNESRRSAETVLRGYAAVRWFLRIRKVDPDDLTAVKLFSETKMAPTGYFESKVPSYLKAWGNRAVDIERVAELTREVLAARKPVAHRVSVMLAQP